MNLDPWKLDRIKPDPRMVNASRDQVYFWARQLYRHWHGDPQHQGECMYWCKVGCTILRLCGYRAIPQAGSMSWPMAPNRGSNDTHFSYIWSPEEQGNRERIEQGLLPEIHWWCGIAQGNTLVDFSTGDLRHLAETRHGLTWELADPPAYLWACNGILPDGVHYEANIDAIGFALAFAEKVERENEAYLKT